MNNLKKQIELLRLRRQATRIAVQLYEASINPENNDAITALFDRCNGTDDFQVIAEAIEALKDMALRQNVRIDT